MKTDPKALTAEREAFEKWALREGYGDLAQEGDRNEFGIDPVYRDPRVHAAWYAWQERATREQTASTGAWNEGFVRGHAVASEIRDIDDALKAARAKFGLVAAPVEQAGSPEKRLKRIAWLIGSIFCHGDFKAETYNERELEKLLRENGTFWDSPAEFYAALDEAPADCDSETTSLEPGASEQDAKKGERAESAPDEIREFGWIEVTDIWKTEDGRTFARRSTLDETPRRVVCAAIRAADGEVLLGIRHYSADMHRQMERRTDGGKFAHRHDPDQGFVDQFGVYMSREEAYQVAQAAGQIVRPKACGEGLDGPKLYSEGLY